MLRRDTPQGDRSELSELLRRMVRPGGSVTVTLRGEPIARIEGPAAARAPRERAPRDEPAPRAPRPGEA
jgi:antitoxin (DNA-binding transcriptional repressor) of toxin-antitoxin stability system